MRTDWFKVWFAFVAVMALGSFIYVLSNDPACLLADDPMGCMVIRDAIEGSR